MALELETSKNLGKLEKQEPRNEEHGYEQDGSSGQAFSDDNWDGEDVEVIDSTVKKRKRRKKRGEEDAMEEKGHSQCQLQDPLVVLGFDIMHMILGLLDARSVALSLLVSRRWHGVACSDRLWAIKVSFCFFFQDFVKVMIFCIPDWFCC